MTKDDYRHFVCIVAGEEPDKLMTKYDATKTVEPYVVYKFKDAVMLKESIIKAYQQQLDEMDKLSLERPQIEETLYYVKGLKPEDAFKMFTFYYEHDPKTGDAVSVENPNGKWSSYNLGQMFSVPFYTLDGREVYQERKENINWEVMNGNGREFFSKVWEMVMEGVEPKNESERNAYENMCNKKPYFNKFGSKEVYVTSNTAFWGYAFLSEETGWLELGPNVDQFEWMSNFYPRFIENLPGNTQLTIFECLRS